MQSESCSKTSRMMCRVLERETYGDNRAISVVWISCRPSKPVTRVRILYRPPSLLWHRESLK